MKIEKLKINAFGNIKNKEIELNEHINILQGNNESGKSTLLKYIINIFYGCSKNKKGKEISDYDKYKPWTGEEFSGKINYILDSGDKYEVFRDFSKKNPVIYDEYLKDISKDFNIDKTNGNQFFIDQTGIDEITFLSTLVSEQQKVKIEQNTQNSILQKLANIAGTGDDNISFKKAVDKINKKQVEEIGTSRTQGRPINVIKEEKFKLQDEIGELENFKERKLEIQREKQEIEKELVEIEEKEKVIKQIKIVKEKQELEEEKIKLNKQVISTQEERKKELQQNLEKVIQENKNIVSKKDNKKTNSKNNKFKILILILFILGIACIIYNSIILKNNIFMAISIIEILISSICFVILNRIDKKKISKEKEENEKVREVKNILEKIETEIRVLDNNIMMQQNQINEQLEKIDKEKQIEKNQIKNQKNELEKIIDELFLLSNIQLSYELQKTEEEKNKKTLEYHSIKLEEGEIDSKLEKIALFEEQLEELNKREEELNKNNEAIELAKEILEIAYQKMKQDVTPKITEQLSNTINNISDGKYKKIVLHEEESIMVEKENGEYISLDRLSIGTIDQLYLSLRLAMAKEVSKESMPIILDEAFAYYDEERLKNILIYLDSEFKDRQIIIFTCTNREKEILKQCNINHKIVEL